MTHQITTLPSGVRVVTEAVPSVRSVTLGLWLEVGARDEAPAQAGCSHFLEHLLFKGSSRRSARDVAEALDAVGGELNAFTAKELTCFHARVIDHDLPLAFEVLADLVVDARNDEADVEAERQVIRSELDLLHDTPDDLVHADLAEVVLGDHPLAAEPLGNAKSIAALDRDTIHAYYLARYRPETLTVAAAGNLDHTRVVALADQLLGDLGRPGGQRPQRHAPTAYQTGQLKLRSRPSEQVHLVVGAGGLAQDHEDRFALRVLDEALGGGMSSRLFQEIRESRGLAYTTFSYASSWTDAGLFAAYVGTAPGDADEALKVLRGQLDTIADDVCADELERAKGALSGAVVLGLEDTGSRMSRIGRQVATGSPIVTVDEALERIAAVGVDDVRRVAGRVLTGPFDLAVVGPVDERSRDRLQASVV